MAGEVPAYLPELVERVGKANHDYFVRRGQTRSTWEGLPPIYRQTAMESHLEILLDGPVALIEREIKAAHEQAPVLRMRLEIYVAELRGRQAEAGRNADLVADELEALINEPLGD